MKSAVVLFAALAMLTLKEDATRLPSVPGATAAQPRDCCAAKAPPRVRCYAWSENVFGEDMPSHGGLVLFLEQDGKVFSRAWQTRSPNNWPPVEGAGMADGARMHLAYRSVRPENSYYHAECEFEFSADVSEFSCRSLQKTDHRPESPLAPSLARGKRVELSAEFAPQVERLKEFAKRARGPSATHCAVLKDRVALPSVSATHAGKTYVFCCSSCREVFLKSPESFTK